MAKKMKPSAGDLFAIELAPGEMLEARILLDVDAQCVVPRRIVDGSPLRFFEGSFLVEISRGDELVLPGVFVQADTWTITDRRTVDPGALYFPQTLTLEGPRPHFSWGEVMLPIALSVEELRAINSPPAILPSVSLVPSSLYALGRKGEIDASFKDPELFTPGRTDLQFSPHLARIHSILGERIESGYFETAIRYGYDPRRFFEASARTLLLCPYCSAQIETTTVACGTCGLDVRNDAPFETTNTELALIRREKCKACKGPMVENSIICVGCKTRQ